MNEEELFIGVIRNLNTVAREDNPNKDETNEDYQVARNTFIAERKAQTHSTTLACEECGLEMGKGYHVHHHDGDHTNQSLKNFRLRCPLCHMVSHLGYVGVENMGTIVYCPDMTQAELNLTQSLYFMMRALLNTLKKGSKEYEKLVGLYHKLELLYQNIEASSAKVIRNYRTDDPLNFANAMLALTDSEYAERGEKTFYGLRLLFKPEVFEKEVGFWMRQYFQPEASTKPTTHPEQWGSTLTIFNKHASRHI